MTTLVVVAKEAVPGRVKTRLHPPYSLEQAATLAQACLLDTQAGRAVDAQADRRTVHQLSSPGRRLIAPSAAAGGRRRGRVGRARRPGGEPPPHRSGAVGRTGTRDRPR